MAMRLLIGYDDSESADAALDTIQMRVVEFF
jgi:hypothetical protein